MKEKYVYTGPTMLLGDYGNIELLRGDKVTAEVNIILATIYKIYNGYNTTVLNGERVEVAAKYLEPVKPDTIHFDPKDDWTRTGDFPKTVRDTICGDDTGYEAALKELYRDAPQGTYFTPKKVMDYLRNHGKDGSRDGHEVGGTHYGKMTIEPWDYIYANKLDFDSGNVVKYISRHKDKNGAEDVKKAISFCKHILKTQYGEE